METIEYWLRSSDGTALYEGKTDNGELHSEKREQGTQSLTSRITSLLRNPNSATNRRPLDKNQGNFAAGSTWDDGRVPHFLDACFLCKQRLRPDRDIYMYRGDVPFCSEECREEQINSDELEEKRAFLLRAAGFRNRRRNNNSSPSVEVRARGPTVAGY